MALTAVGLLVSRWKGSGGDDVYYAAMGRALLNSGTFDLRYADGPTPSDEVGKHYLGTHAPGSPAMYSQWPFGQSLLMAPFIALGRAASARIDDPLASQAVQKLALSLLPASLFAATTVLLFLFLYRRLGYDRGASLAMSLLFAFATTAFAYATTGYSEPVQGLLILLLAFIAFGETSWTTLPAFALGCAALLLVQYRYLAFLPAFALLALVRDARARLTRWPSLLMALLIVALAGATLAYWNRLRSGALTGFYGPAGQTMGVFKLSALPGLWLDLFVYARRNLFLYVPLFLLGVLGCFWYRTPGPWTRRYATVVGVLFGTALGLYGSAPSLAWGAICWGPRYLVPFFALMMPFVWAGVTRLWALPGLQRIAGVGATGAVIACSVYVQILGLAYSWFFAMNFCGGSSQFADYVMQRAGITGLGHCDLDAKWATSTVAIHHFALWNVPGHLADGPVKEMPWLGDTQSLVLTRAFLHDLPELRPADLMFFHTLPEGMLGLAQTGVVSALRVVLLALIASASVLMARTFRGVPPRAADLDSVDNPSVPAPSGG